MVIESGIHNGCINYMQTYYANFGTVNKKDYDTLGFIIKFISKSIQYFIKMFCSWLAGLAYDFYRSNL